MEERLQKIMARAGLGSRRSCEIIISEGRVVLNGKLAVLGTKADPTKDHIFIDGKRLGKPEPFAYYALHKPRGVLSTVSTPDTRKTVLDYVPTELSVYPVGRLDVDSEGLILLTNDGDLANRLTHPKFQHEKEYRVLVASPPDAKQIEAWKHGVVLEDGFKTSPVQIRIESKFGKGVWLRVLMKEGHKRQIRETGKQIGVPVIRIVRVRIATLNIGNLQPGEWRVLSQKEINALKSLSTSPRGQRKNKHSRRFNPKQ